MTIRLCAKCGGAMAAAPCPSGGNHQFARALYEKEEMKRQEAAAKEKK